MQKVEYRQGVEFTKSHACGEKLDTGEACRRGLILAWHGNEQSYVVKCSLHPNSEQFVPLEGAQQRYNRGREVEPYSKQALDAKRERKVSQGSLRDVGTNTLLSTEAVAVLIEYASRYGLDVYRNHVVMMYGKPYVELDGLYYLAYKTNEFDGVTSRPMRIDEKRLYGWGDNDYAWVAEVRRSGKAHPFVGTERVTDTKVTAKTDDGRFRYPMFQIIPDRMADKQAQRYALRAAFPDVAMPPDDEGAE